MAKFDPLSEYAIVTALLLSALSILIIAKNRKLDYYSKLRYPVLVLSFMFLAGGYMTFARVHPYFIVGWYLLAGLPTYFLYYQMFKQLKKEIRGVES